MRFSSIRYSQLSRFGRCLWFSKRLTIPVALVLVCLRQIHSLSRSHSCGRISLQKCFDGCILWKRFELCDSIISVRLSPICDFDHSSDQFVVLRPNSCQPQHVRWSGAHKTVPLVFVVADSILTGRTAATRSGPRNESPHRRDR